MSALTITLDDAETVNALAMLRMRLGSLGPPLDEIGADFESRIQLCFRDGRTPFGAPWAPLSATTISRRRKGSSTPLRDTGRLANSISHRVDGDTAVVIGTNVEYAPTHQFGALRGAYGRTRRGSLIPWGNVPARPFLPAQTLPDDWRASALEIVSAYLLDRAA